MSISLKRELLPNPCFGQRWRFCIGEQEVYLHSGEYSRGGLGEFFITLHDKGLVSPELQNKLTVFAIQSSKKLQKGCPIEIVRRDWLLSLRYETCPDGDDELRMYSHIVMAVFSTLGSAYLGAFFLTELVEIRSNRLPGSWVWVTSVYRGSLYQGSLLESNLDEYEGETLDPNDWLGPLQVKKDLPWCPNCEYIMAVDHVGYKCMKCGQSAD